MKIFVVVSNNLESKEMFLERRGKPLLRNDLDYSSDLITLHREWYEVEPYTSVRAILRFWNKNRNGSDHYPYRVFP